MNIEELKADNKKKIIKATEELYIEKGIFKDQGMHDAMCAGLYSKRYEGWVHS